VRRYDTLFFKQSHGLATTLVAKGCVLAHNPIGAFRLTDTCYRRPWGPHSSDNARRIPAEGRRCRAPWRPERSAGSHFAESA